MSVEIPEELMHPTVEELEVRTAADMAKKWKPCRKPGKRERYVIKRQKESAKLREIADEFDKTKQIGQNSLSTLFVKAEKKPFSLADVSVRKNDQNTTPSLSGSRPTLRVSLDKTASPLSNMRKRGRPPRVNPL